MAWKTGLDHQSSRFIGQERGTFLERNLRFPVVRGDECPCRYSRAQGDEGGVVNATNGWGGHIVKNLFSQGSICHQKDDRPIMNGY